MTSLKEKILELRLSGFSYRMIEEALGCSRSTIHFHCSRSDTADIGTKHAELDEELKARISNYTRNHSLSEAMSHFGLSRSTIKRYKYKHIKSGEELPDDLKESIRVFTMNHTLEEATVHFQLKLSQIKKYKFDKGLKRSAIDGDLKNKIREFCKTHSTKEAVEHFGISRASIIKYKK